MIFAFLFCDLKNVFLKVFFYLWVQPRGLLKCASTLADCKIVRLPSWIKKYASTLADFKSVRHPRGLLKCASTLADYKSVRPPSWILKVCVHPRGL